MKRLLPAPLMSLLLFVTWLLLNESASTGNLLLAALLAVGVPWFTAEFRPDRPRIRNWGTVLRLGGVVLMDIVLSNIEVAKRVLGPEAAIVSRFVWLPLRIRDPHGIVALAGIITLTPGTLSSEISPDQRFLLVHALHCPNAEAEAALVASIQARYETPLMEIFE